MRSQTWANWSPIAERGMPGPLDNRITPLGCDMAFACAEQVGVVQAGCCTADHLTNLGQGLSIWQWSGTELPEGV